MKVLIFKDIKNNRWTVWDEHKKKHLFYANELQIINATFFIDEIKRKKVLKTKKRFPHAWIIGTLSMQRKKLLKEVKYNPFLNTNFICENRKIKNAKQVSLTSDCKVFV